MEFNGLFLSAFCLTLVAILYLAWRGDSKVKDSAGYVLGNRKAGCWGVFGAICGTLVGGASTIGTAQLAFMWGLSAWWFTLGAGLACLFLALFIAVPLRNSEVETIPEFISHYYGERARVAASLFTAVGMFIQIVAQLLACGAILAVLFEMRLVVSAGLSALFVLLFTLGGGMKSAGITGLVKMLLIYATMLLCGLIVLLKTGGGGALWHFYPRHPWFNIFGYGFSKGVSDVLSMLVGVISTQTYLQAIFSASNGKVARKGACLSALFIPPLGLLGVLVGLYMRQTHPQLQSALTLPTFIMEQMPTAAAGIAFATLLIAAIGTASGLALGVATTLRVDILTGLFKDQRHDLLFFRALTVIVVSGAFVLLLFNLGSAIMDWSFLSMGLRGATLFFPLLFAVFAATRTTLKKAGIWSVFLAPLVVIVSGALNLQLVQPLYLGLGTSLFIFLLFLVGMQKS